MPICMISACFRHNPYLNADFMVKNNITHNAAQQSESLDSVLLRFQII